MILEVASALALNSKIFPTSTSPLSVVLLSFEDVSIDSMLDKPFILLMTYNNMTLM